MSQRLAGRVAIVTGASWGIGAAVSEAFAAEGASVVINSVPDSRMVRLAGEVADRITASGGSAIVVPGDVSDPADVAAVVGAAEDAFGDPDVLVANAATSHRDPWHEIDDDDWDRIFAVNVHGTFNCARAVYPAMQRNGRGSIITLTSVMAGLGMTGALAYVSSKAALIGFTRALAREIGVDGIRVNAVMPGAIRTEHEVEMGGDPEAAAERLAGLQSLKRRGFAEDLTGTFVYLASDDSEFVTGQVLNVDGGWYNY